MPEDKRVIITKDTAISLGLALSICSAIWFISDLNARVNGVEKKTFDNPTRVEFQTLQQDVSEIKIDVKTLIKESGKVSSSKD